MIWKCDREHFDCGDSCYLEVAGSMDDPPTHCPYGHTPHWESYRIDRPRCYDACDMYLNVHNTKLPDWVKPGNWVWIDPEKDPLSDGYMQIEAVNGDLILLDAGQIHFDPDIVLRARPKMEHFVPYLGMWKTKEK